MSKKFLNALQYTLFLGLGIFLLWLSARNLSEENTRFLKSSLTNANYWLIALPMVIVLLSHYSRALRWKILIQPLGYSPSVINTFFATMLGYFFNLLVPRLGEVMKCTILAKHEKIPADKLIGTMVTERVCDLICLIVVFLITIFIQFNVIHQYASAQLRILLYDETGNFKMYKLFIVIGVLAAVSFLLRWLLKKYAASRFVQKIKSLLQGIWSGITSIQHLQNKWLFLFHTVFIWSMYIVSVRVGLLTMEAVSHLGFEVCFSIISFGSLAMIATQGGIGAYQYTIQKLLPLYGIAEGPALGFGWMLWIAQTGIVIFTGMICLLFLPIINRGKHEISPVNQE
ncbi:MAG: lysylphosphatidylglycerol synthase transmembrane domain-containing protein [Agriterribacter sp.]